MNKIEILEYIYIYICMILKINGWFKKNTKHTGTRNGKAGYKKFIDFCADKEIF